MRIRLTEHSWLRRPRTEAETVSGQLSEEARRRDGEELSLFEELLADPSWAAPTLFKNKQSAFSLKKLDGERCELQADYFVGADWLIEGQSYLQVVPKIDRAASKEFERGVQEDESPSESARPEPGSRLNSDYIQIGGVGSVGQVHYLRMLMTIAQDSYFDKHLRELFYINYGAKPLPLKAEDDYLTPLLIVRFVQVLKRIVSKGLRKSYYSVQRNVSNRVKGKVLVSGHIKQNVFKSRLNTVLCQYDYFGENTLENQFIKKVLRFARRYLDTHGVLFGDTLGALNHTVRSVAPAFDLVDELEDEAQLKHTWHHPFYGEYKEAIRVGRLLLKRFSYSVNAIDEGEVVLTPPYWINMPILFEMYVCAVMRAHNPECLREISYQFSAYGNKVDILVGAGAHPIVIDTKYKLTYRSSQHHADIRQVAGYARLKSVRRKVGIADSADDTIDCLIIYPDVEDGIEDLSLSSIWQAKQAIAPYHRVWKLPVKIPVTGYVGEVKESPTPNPKRV